MKLHKSVNHWFRKRAVPPLGERELEVMKILWRDTEVSAQQLLGSAGDGQLSLSTLQSTLERLHRKQLVVRRKEGRYFVYAAAVSQSDLICQLLQDIVREFSDGDVAPMISGFNAFVAEANHPGEYPVAEDD